MNTIAPQQAGIHFARVNGRAFALAATLLIGALLSSFVQAGHHKTTEQNIVQTAAAAGQFETLIAAAKAAGLVEALSAEGPLTVFAPTDEAFAALPAGTVETLLQPENAAQLARILKYHVVAGKVGSRQLADGASVRTLAGEVAGFTATGGGFAIEGARITATDIEASNGIVHVIDRVILPPEQLSMITPEGLIAMAIEQGVPLFNNGNHGATAAIYEITARSLMSFAGLEAAENDRLARGVMAARRAANPAQAAWELRFALDEVSTSLRERRMVASR
jgi:uncharacterized surface protein with fasciclin (FAS1) repeats